MAYDILVGDVIKQLKTLAPTSIQSVITSPPYWGLRDYGADGQLGLEATPQEYVSNLVNVFREVRRVLKDNGTVWLNLGDSYAGSGKGRNADGSHQLGGKQGTNRGTIAGILTKSSATGLKPKDLVGIPWKVAFALQEDGWYLRQDIIWHKTNPMPESVKDRCTKSHEYMFLLTKSDRYYFDHEAIKEDAKWERWGDQTVDKQQQGTAKWIGNKGKAELQALGKRNKRDVWSIPTQPYRGAHFAVFPEKLVEPCLLAGSSVGDIVLDTFCGSGTVGVVAQHYGRNFIGIEINPDYVPLAHERIAKGSRRLEKQVSKEQEDVEESVSGTGSDGGVTNYDHIGAEGSSSSSEEDGYSSL
jgi:DNA modification methylase